MNWVDMQGVLLHDNTLTYWGAPPLPTRKDCKLHGVHSCVVVCIVTFLDLDLDLVSVWRIHSAQHVSL